MNYFCKESRSKKKIIFFLVGEGGSGGWSWRNGIFFNKESKTYFKKFFRGEVGRRRVGGGG